MRHFPLFRTRGCWRLLPLILCIVCAHAAGAEADSQLREEARAALRRGVEFFRKQVAVEGSYLWQYTEDLGKREGEGVATASQGWVQPPGTPAVGMALLDAYHATGDKYYYEAARETAQALIRGQLRSGGWAYVVDFNPQERKKLAYRQGGGEKGRNRSVLDDNTTQSALLFLIRMDVAAEFKDPELRDCVRYALESLLEAQYPNGGWPQVYEGRADPETHPVLRASYPPAWPRKWPGSQRYWQGYTLNDNLLADLLPVMFEAERVYAVTAAGAEFNQLAKRARAAAEKAGDFLILAQMPEPQPAWAQQYDAAMHPVWARKFEPPAVTGGESQSALRVLLMIYRHSGQKRFLEPIPKALEYLRRSRLPDGRLARFYELESNKPLYFTREYEMTYSDADCPTHYAFKVGDRTPEIEREYQQALKQAAPGATQRAKELAGERVEATEVKRVIAAQDAQGRWVETGGLRYQEPKGDEVRVIRSATFIRNVELLSRYLD